MNQKAVDSLKVRKGLASYLRELAVITGIISGMFTTGYTYIIKPKMESEIKAEMVPVKKDIMFIKILLEESTPPEIIEKAQNRMEFLTSNGSK